MEKSSNSEKSKRLTFSPRELYVMRKVLAYMTSKASPLNDQGACLLEMAMDELHSLRARLS
jgi:hypothetical protein